MTAGSPGAPGVRGLRRFVKPPAGVSRPGVQPPATPGQESPPPGQESPSPGRAAGPAGSGRPSGSGDGRGGGSRTVPDVQRGPHRPARAPGGHRQAVAGLRLPRVLPAVHPRRRGGRPVPGRARAGLSRPGPAADRRGLERAADPGRDGLFLLQLGAGPGGGGLPEPGRADRMRARPHGLGPARRHAPAARGDGARRRGHLRQPHGKRQCQPGGTTPKPPRARATRSS